MLLFPPHPFLTIIGVIDGLIEIENDEFLLGLVSFIANVNCVIWTERKWFKVIPSLSDIAVKNEEWRVGGVGRKDHCMCEIACEMMHRSLVRKCLCALVPSTSLFTGGGGGGVGQGLCLPHLCLHTSLLHLLFHVHRCKLLSCGYEERSQDDGAIVVL
jgi:hypothetical protein